jgi:hypothetical protein
VLLLSLGSFYEAFMVGNLQMDQTGTDGQHPKDNKRRDKERAAG